MPNAKHLVYQWPVELMVVLDCLPRLTILNLTLNKRLYDTEVERRISQTLLHVSPHLDVIAFQSIYSITASPRMPLKTRNSNLSGCGRMHRVLPKTTRTNLTQYTSHPQLGEPQQAIDVCLHLALRTSLINSIIHSIHLKSYYTLALEL